MLDDIFIPYGCTIKSTPLRSPQFLSYNIKCNVIGLNTSFVWNRNYKLEQVLKPNIHKFLAILFNDVQLNPEIDYDEDKLNDFINNNYTILTPNEKLDSILEYISKSASFDGQLVELKTPNRVAIAKSYFNNSNEWQFYLDNAKEQGYIQRKTTGGLSSANENSVSVTKYNLTVSGLTRLIAINERKNSRFCFVAMAFTTEMETYYLEGIEPAIRICGFEPYIVSKVNVESDKTINDAILAGIKKARFTIADFTYHRGGVYFEAGYALGRGQNVIYTCREDEMNKAHFDIRNYQHIVWSDAEDLKEKLINKIEAFIKD